MSTSDTATYSSSASRIGDRIKRIRTERGMSRAELGEKIGLCQNRVQQYENGRRKPKAPLRELLTTYLSVEVGASCFIYHGAFSEETVSYVISTGVNSGGSRPMYGIRSGSKKSYAFPVDVDGRIDIPVIFRAAFRAADLPDGKILCDRVFVSAAAA